jgi:tripartite-type tricarboxylate transporter receptor subunit TctC
MAEHERVAMPFPTGVRPMVAVSLLGLSGLYLLPSLQAHAQAYPAKPIRLVVPFPPSGGTDVLARIITPKFAEALAQQVVIDNRSGANGNVGTELVARAAPDGYTLLLNGGGTLAVNPSLYSKLPYDSLRDFAPISLVVLQPSVLVVHPSVPAKSVAELIALARTRPGQLNFASSGSGSLAHLSAEIFKTMAKVDMVHVPYKGAGPSMADLIAGQVHLVFASSPSVMPHVRNGKLRALGVTTAKRARATPEVPTIAEAGVPGFEVTGWYGLLAPAGTPASIVDRLNSDLIRVLGNAEVEEKLVGQGLEVATSTPKAFGEFIRTEIAKYAKVVKEAGVKVD